MFPNCSHKVDIGNTREINRISCGADVIKSSSHQVFLADKNRDSKTLYKDREGKSAIQASLIQLMAVFIHLSASVTTFIWNLPYLIFLCGHSHNADMRKSKPK